LIAFLEIYYFSLNWRDQEKNNYNILKRRFDEKITNGRAHLYAKQKSPKRAALDRYT
jgi:hypothetical protein